MPIAFVSDANALIALDRIRLLETLGPLLDGLLVPPAVAQEIAPSVRMPAWCSVRELAQQIPDTVRRAGLGQGETEAIALSIELDRRPLILDERRARQTAITLDLPIVGTAGLLVLAKREGLLDVIRPHLEALMATGFFVSHNIIERALRQAGE